MGRKRVKGGIRLFQAFLPVCASIHRRIVIIIKSNKENNESS